MLNDQALADHLVKAGALDATQLEEAANKASASQSSLDEAIVTMGLLDKAALGNVYSQVTTLPYKPISNEKDANALEMMSSTCAEHWQVLPLNFSAENNLLTIAIHDPDQIPQLEAVNRFLMQSHSIAFTIASLAEIKTGIKMHYYCCGIRGTGTSCDNCQVTSGDHPKENTESQA